jgi:hypothetical protein
LLDNHQNDKVLYLFLEDIEDALAKKKPWIVELFTTPFKWHITTKYKIIMRKLYLKAYRIKNREKRNTNS